MNLTQILARVYKRVGRKDDTTLDDDITYACELVQDDIMSKINFSSLMTLDKTTIQMTADTQTYSLPTDFWKMIMMWESLNYDRELIRIVPQEYKNYLGDIDTDTETEPHYYDLLDASATAKKIIFFDYLATGGTSFYIPFIYMKKLAYLSSSNASHILSATYGNLFVEGASYIMYRDVIYRDQPEKIAFRKAEYKEQIENVKSVEKDPNLISKVAPKRILPSMRRKLNTQTSGYTS